MSFSRAPAVTLAPADTFKVVLAGNARPAAARPVRPSRPMSPVESAMSKPKQFDADSMVLDKSNRVLTMFFHGEKVREYQVALGRDPVGPKLRRGDGRTPEGLYFIEGRNPESKYHLSLRISYPSRSDLSRASRMGVTTGGDVMIHGLPPAFASVGALHRQQDWTEGCIAVTNAEIEEIWRAVPNGAKLLIQP
jgi:murein L,D-transpeptidase YafK